MRRSNVASLLVGGVGAGIVATAMACTGGPAIDDGNLNTSSSGVSGSSGVSSSSSGGPTGSTLVNDTFSHSCNVDEDCTLALLYASTCGFCRSTNAAIAKTDEAAYQSAYNEARANCPQDTAGAGTCAAYYNVSRCNTSKTCELVQCGSRGSVDEHHCTGDGG